MTFESFLFLYFILIILLQRVDVSFQSSAGIYNQIYILSSWKSIACSIRDYFSFRDLVPYPNNGVAYKI